MSILDEIPVDGTLLDDLTPPYRTNKERGAAQKEVFEKVGPKLREILGMFEINTKYRIAHFLAQCAVETMDFTSLTEWDDGSAYEGKEDLGNKEKGDGPKFRGRGLIHLTGRWNYNYVNDIIHKKRYTDKFPGISKIDIVKNPEKVADISWCLIISAIFWDFKNINITADVNDVDKVTFLVNGGYNRLEERREYTKLSFILIEKRIKDAAITTKLAIPRLVFPLAGWRALRQSVRWVEHRAGSNDLPVEHHAAGNDLHAARFRACRHDAGTCPGFLVCGKHSLGQVDVPQPEPLNARRKFIAEELPTANARRAAPWENVTDA